MEEGQVSTAVHRSTTHVSLTVMEGSRAVATLGSGAVSRVPYILLLPKCWVVTDTIYLSAFRGSVFYRLWPHLK